MQQRCTMAINHKVIDSCICQEFHYQWQSHREAPRLYPVIPTAGGMASKSTMQYRAASIFSFEKMAWYYKRYFRGYTLIPELAWPLQPTSLANLPAAVLLLWVCWPTFFRCAARRRSCLCSSGLRLSNPGPPVGQQRQLGDADADDGRCQLCARILWHRDAHPRHCCCCLRGVEAVQIFRIHFFR